MIKKSSKKQIQIGILETYSHVPIIENFCKIFNIKNVHITLFTTKKIKNRLESVYKDINRITILLKKESEGHKKFLKRVEIHCNNKIDLLFINTIKENPLDLLYYVKFNPKTKTILTIHHVNTWLSKKTKLTTKNPIKVIKTKISIFLIRSLLIEKFDAINVIYSPLKEYIKKSTKYDKPVFTLPTSIHELSTKKLKKTNKKIKIVIPGLISQRHKSFKPVFKALDALSEKNKKFVQIIILGRPMKNFGKNIQEKFLEYKKNGFDIVLFSEFIPDDIYKEEISRSDILLTPIKTDTKSNIEIFETYGKTIGSGLLYDAIKYAKPIIVPSDFNILQELNTSTMKYKDYNDLQNIIEDLIKNKKRLAKLKTEAQKNSKKCSLDFYQKYFKANILKWLDNDGK